MRPIDKAMTAPRAAKDTIRELWIDDVEHRTDRGAEGPLYVTLCGAAGIEIQMLIDRGVIRVTETGAIQTDDAHLVVAVESGSDAVLDLKRRFPGLKVVQRSFFDLLGGANPMAWGKAEDRRLCRGSLVNLDFNQNLKAEVVDGQLNLKQLEAVKKLATIQADAPHQNWTLFLTLNASIQWNEEILKRVFEFISSNFAESDDFRLSCEALFSPGLLTAIKEVDCSFEPAMEDAQHLLMALVPKTVVLMSQRQWLIRTRRNIRYGGSDSAAPMVTFALDFEWDERGSARPLDVYRDGLAEVLRTPAVAADDGSLVSAAAAS